jgi:hypothetical protein
LCADVLEDIGEIGRSRDSDLLRSRRFLRPAGGEKQDPREQDSAAHRVSDNNTGLPCLSFSKDNVV